MPISRVETLLRLPMQPTPLLRRFRSMALTRRSGQGFPYLRLEREPWVPAAGDRWIGVPNIAGAVAALPSGSRVLLTIGRKEIAPFLSRSDISGVARMIEKPPLAIATKLAAHSGAATFQFGGRTQTIA